MCVRPFFFLKKKRFQIDLITSLYYTTNKHSQHSSIIRPAWLNDSVFVYELSGCKFESRFCHLNFRYCVSFERGVPWHSGKYRVQIHYEMRTWHEITYCQMYHIYKYSQHSSIVWPAWLNGWVFLSELCGCGFKDLWGHLAFFQS